MLLSFTNEHIELHRCQSLGLDVYPKYLRFLASVRFWCYLSSSGHRRKLCRLLAAVLLRKASRCWGKQSGPVLLAHVLVKMAYFSLHPLSMGLLSKIENLPADGSASPSSRYGQPQSEERRGLETERPFHGPLMWWEEKTPVSYSSWLQVIHKGEICLVPTLECY